MISCLVGFGGSKQNTGGRCIAVEYECLTFRWKLSYREVGIIARKYTHRWFSCQAKLPTVNTALDWDDYTQAFYRKIEKSF